MFRIKQLYWLIIVIVTPLQSFAVDLRYSAGVSVGNYDNINLVSQPTESETSYDLNGSLSMFEDAANLFVNLSTDIQVINYQKDLADDETRLQLRSDIIWRIKPGQFEWVFNDNFTQSVIDPLGSDAPSNRQNINVLSTGPNYTIRFNPRSNLRIESRIENYSFEVNTDNNRGFLALRYLHNMNSAVTISLNNEGEITRFDDSINNIDFNRNDVFLGFNYARGLNALDAEYGITHITNEGSPDLNTDRYLLTFSNQRTQTSSINFTYQRLLSDTGSNVLNLNGDQDLTNLVDSVGNDIFIDENYRFDYLKSLSGGSVSFGLYANDRGYRGSPTLDENSDGAYITFLWNLQRNSSVNFNLRGVNTYFSDPATNREDTDKSYSATYTYGLRRNMNISIQATGRDRLSTQITESYDDLRIFISLNYTSQ